MNTGMITFDQEKYRRLQERYDLAVKQNEEVFTFDGNQLVTGYAKYLLEYLAIKFDKKGDA